MNDDLWRLLFAAAYGGLGTRLAAAGAGERRKYIAGKFPGKNEERYSQTKVP
jgi:hypothetical protein